MSVNNIVLISEYDMPEDFECIWEKTYTSSLSVKNKSFIKRERLFMYKNGIKSL